MICSSVKRPGFKSIPRSDGFYIFGGALGPARPRFMINLGTETTGVVVIETSV